MVMMAGAWAQTQSSFVGKLITADIYSSWAGNYNYLSANDLPGFQSVTQAEAEAWTGVPTTGNAYLIYDFNDDNPNVAIWTDGVYQGSATLYEFYRDDCYNNITNGRPYFYPAIGEPAGPEVIPVPNVENLWTLEMPAGYVELEVTYYELPELAWKIGNEDVPAEGVSAYARFPFEAPTLINIHQLSPINFMSTVPNVATIDADGNITTLAPGTTIIKAIYAGNDTYQEDTASYLLNVIAPPVLTLDFNDGGTVTCSGGKIYTSANLHQGDTLRVGDQLVGFQEIGLNQGTFTSTNSNSLYSDVWFQYDTITIGANGVISYSNPNNDSNNGDYTPNGNAWMVTHYFGGSSFRMSGMQADGNSGEIVVVDDTHVLVLPGTTVRITATPDEKYYLQGWGDQAEPVISAEPVVREFVMGDHDTTITATFTPFPTLTLAANGDGTVELEGAAGSYDILVNGTVTYTNVNIPTVFYPIPVGTQIYSIEGANGKIQSDGDFYKITDFFEGTATVQTNGGNFTVSLTPSLPAGIVATETEGHCLVLPGTVVTINATTNQLRHVAGWSDEEQNDLSSLATYSDYFVTEPENLFPAKSSINVTVTGDTTMMASFGINSYTVTAKVNNDNRDMIGSGLPMGSVSATYIAVDGTPDQSVAPAAAITYTAQGASTSTLTAIPDTGYHFVKWNDDVTDNPRSLTLTVDSNLTAIFAPNSYTVTYLRGRGTIVLNVDTFKYREPITDYTPLRDGRSFIEWRPALPTYMPAENLTVVAYWKCLSVEDYDGNVYPTVNISDICWMAANMRATHFADGRELNNIYEYQCDMYPNVQETVSIFGRLYEWYDAFDTSTLESSTSRIQGICPDGWVLPNDEDFEILNNMDVQTLRSTNYWLYNSGNNSTGFDLRPAGMYNSATARYENLLGNTYLWSATTISSTEAHCHMADCNCYMLMDIVNYKSNAFSVRCIKE